MSAPPGMPLLHAPDKGSDAGGLQIAVPYRCLLQIFCAPFFQAFAYQHTVLRLLHSRGESPILDTVSSPTMERVSVADRFCQGREIPAILPPLEVEMVRIGSCSWKFPSWNGLVYDSNSHARFLAQYAGHYETVEIDQWFWSLFGERSIAMPKIETVAEYLADTPDSFTFSIKAPNSITLTHYYSRGRQKEQLTPNPWFLDRDLFLRFLEAVQPLQERTVSVMLQFEYLNKRKIASPAEFIQRLDAFLSSLGPAAETWNIGVEPRNPQFLDDRYFRTLASHRAHHVFTHGYFMPAAYSVFAEYGHLLTDRTVIRLLGADRKSIEKECGKRWNERIRAKPDDLTHIAEMIYELQTRAIDTTVNVNNHYEGSAPLTIGVLQEKLLAL